MPTVEARTFEETLDLTKGMGRDLLLGNGFSIAAYEGFDYRRLLDRAHVPEEVRHIFATARTSNFEAVMRILLADSVGMNAGQARETREKIEALKSALVESVHQVHPPRRTAISQAQWDHCESFLEHFIGRKRAGRVFTTNYDLLLSWAVAPDRDRGKQRRLNAYEGFRGGPYDSLGSATIIYLHGALHLWADRGYPRQIQYRTTGVALHDQVRALLDSGLSPIVVTEGASALKEPKSPGFLKDAHTAFRGTCKGGSKKALFTVGHGLGPEDAHLFDWIPRGTIETVCLGAFGRSEMDVFRSIAEGWVGARSRSGKPPLTVYLFDSTHVAWGADITRDGQNR